MQIDKYLATRNWRKGQIIKATLFAALVGLGCLGVASAATPQFPAAPVQILLFTDFECPFCARLAPALSEVTAAYTTQVRVTLKHNPLPMHSHARLAHAGALAASEQGKFWEMHDLLFANQSHLEKSDLIGYARKLALDVPAFEAALGSEGVERIIASDIAEAQALGVTGTPTLFVNGRKLVGAQSAGALKIAIDQALGIQPAGTEQISGTKPIPIDVLRTVFRGPENAPITIIEFSDLQCPFCVRTLPVLEQLAKEYPTQIRFGVKHYPLDFHANALSAAEALEAAGAQGKYWQMHDLLFARQSTLTRPVFEGAAKELGLDLARFNADLDSHRFLSKIDADKAEGTRVGVEGTPVFFINGKRLDGARPVADFERMVQAELASLKLPTAPQLGVPSPNRQEPRFEFEKGPSNAPITLLWFSDVQSPLTPRADVLVREIMTAYPGKVRVILRHRPLENHPQAGLAHEAMLAAGAQGRFWEMHDLLITNQKALSETDLTGYAARLKLDTTAFDKALREHTYLPVIGRDIKDARSREIRGTPVFFVNGKRIDGLQPMSLFRDYIEPEAKRSPAASNVPAAPQAWREH